MSYTIDVYRGKMQAARNWIDFGLYVAYFPQLVAGPIERATRLLPQIESPRAPIPHAFEEGLYCVVLGIFKKVFVADSMAMIANGIFASNTSELSGLEVLLGVYAFAFQIYCDFSGYSSIAQGVSKWFGIELMDNFQTPYFASNPSEFWQRWHISLSQWLRDYVYIPLGGNRTGKIRTYGNLMATMLLGGLWHGANWTYVVWGAYHGVLLCLFHALSPAKGSSIRPLQSVWRQRLATIAFFQLVCLGWLIFRAKSLEQVVAMLSSLASPWSHTLLSQSMIGMLLFYVAPLLFFERWSGGASQSPRLLHQHWSVRAVTYALALHLILFFSAPTTSQFIYFQF
jgi:D-alanyl-lipoteichoic acid acyltransferase DltB (MBOAT superfamily)